MLEPLVLFHFCRHLKPLKGRKINWMKAAILESDMVLTVSPYYAEELISGLEKGVELDNIIRRTGITGVINGMDVQEWNPSTDKYINVKYNAATVSPLLRAKVSLICVIRKKTYTSQILFKFPLLRYQQPRLF